MARILRISGPIVALVAGAAACSATPQSLFTSATGTEGQGGSANHGSGNGASMGSGASAGSAQGGAVSFTVSSGSGTTTGSGNQCVVTDMNADMDNDGWSPAQGDCNDCDPNVNPGAVDVAGDPNKIDSDCDGKYDPPAPCDTGLALDDVNPQDGAKAIELCQFTTGNPPNPKNKVWGVIDARYTRADGSAYTNPGLQVGLQPNFGPNVNVQGGATMLMISSGYARTSSQPGACGSMSCESNAGGTPPPGFPVDNPACPPTPDINDDVGLDLTIRAPTNATGYSFSFKFYSMEFPFWVCNSYNDQFIALVNPAPMGSLNGDISFDSMHNPVSVNLAFFTVCDPSQEGQYCGGGGQCTPGQGPSPYCPSGPAQLSGTGFDQWDSDYGGAGATTWLQSQAPVTGGQNFEIRFAMWDSGDQLFDSSTLVDNWQWIATKGTVTVSTQPMPMPK